MDTDEHPSEPGIVPFFFDGNQWNGTVDSADQMFELLKAYGLQATLDAKRYVPPDDDEWNRKHPRTIPKFGYRMECRGPGTLGEWADSVGFDIRSFAAVLEVHKL